MPPASSPCQLRFACWNSGFECSVTRALRSSLRFYAK
ncbi:hypothetical protein SLEP1_g37176 [Rubroshorea leprosula]|uniref:Uncharacterized protein n=1 Tax=Rubroshorea leprosula TaxID=152421 RepID=A0AAV5KU06_9ROSI|nr:hypothetical protein SLEP1_g37176 [Rubroshorea leprosula]